MGHCHPAFVASRLTNSGRPDLPARGDKTMSNFVTRFLKDESGATAIEYGLIAALIAAVLATVLGTIGTKLNTKLGEGDAAISG